MSHLKSETRKAHIMDLVYTLTAMFTAVMFYSYIDCTERQ